VLVLASVAAADYSQLSMISTGAGSGASTLAVSPDGQSVIFETDAQVLPSDTDGQIDIYRWSSGSLTQISTGPAGGNGAFRPFFSDASADGGHAFFVTREPLVAADTDQCTSEPGPPGCWDLYERTGSTTSLVSTGPAASNGLYDSSGTDHVSADGSKVVFETTEPLVSADTDSCGVSPPGCNDLYERASGVTTLLSTGTKNANSDDDAFGSGASSDGSVVIFTTTASLVTADHDSSRDLYQRSGGTTTLVSTGPSGGNGPYDADAWNVSADGARIVFQTDERLVAADTDSGADIYERAGGTTTLVSIGPAGGNGAYGPSVATVGASSDGTKVFFETHEPLVSADTDSCDNTGWGEPPGCFDLYERAGGQTTLLSIGPQGGSADYDIESPYISADGSRAYFYTRESLVPEDDDCLPSGCPDVYLRSGNQTTLISVNAPNVAPSGEPYFAGESADGSRVFFRSTDHFLPEDTDNADDIYMRYAGTTSMVPEIGNSDRYTVLDHVSADGSRILFHTDAGLLTSDTDNADDIYSASLAAGYARPKGAGPSYLSLVPAYTACTTPDRTHAPPLSFGSCAPPAQSSSNLTAGTPDSNGAGANQTGFVRITPVIGAPGPPDDSDVSMQLVLNDMRCKADVSTCGDANTAAGPDYTGELQGSFAARITDKFNGGSTFTEPATVNDMPLSFTAACSASASTAVGSSCSAATSLNALIPGAIKDTGRTVFEFTQVRVLDGGPDGVASSGPNDLYAVQGVFAP
jgi:hypothetical protein